MDRGSGALWPGPRPAKNQQRKTNKLSLMRLLSRIVSTQLTEFLLKDSQQISFWYTAGTFMVLTRAGPFRPSHYCTTETCRYKEKRSGASYLLAIGVTSGTISDALHCAQPLATKPRLGCAAALLSIHIFPPDTTFGVQNFPRVDITRC